MEKGSFEARLWIKDYTHPRKGFPVVGAIHDFIIYRKICLTCTDEEIYQLNNLVQKYGMNNGLRMAINEIQRKVMNEDYDKKCQIDNLAEPDTLTVKYEQKKFEEELAESDLEFGFTAEQLQKRNGKYPFGNGNINMIPESILTSQKVIDQGVYKGIIRYTLYDKIYGCWSAKIMAPFIKPIIVKQNTLAQAKNWLNVMLERAHIDSTKAKVQMMRQVEQEKNAKKKEEAAAQAQISKIRKILGQENGDNNLNTPDIF